MNRIFGVGFSALAAGVCAGLVACAGVAGASGFLPPRVLNDYSELNINEELKPRVATDGAGRWLAGWIGPYEVLMVAPSVTSGTEWLAARAVTALPVMDPPAGEPEYIPVVEMDICYGGEGRWLAMWLEDTPDDNMGFKRAFSEDFGVTWSVPEDVYPAAADSAVYSYVEFVSDGAGRVAAFFDYQSSESSSDRGLKVMTSLDAGRTWSGARDVVPLNMSSFGPRPAVTFTESGRLLAVYPVSPDVPSVPGSGFEYVLTVSDDLGETWEEMGPVVRTWPSGLNFPGIDMAEGGGEAVIALSGMVSGPDGSRFGVFVSVSDDDGTSFSAPKAIALRGSNFYAQPVALARDDAGRWMVAANDGDDDQAYLNVWETSDLSGEWSQSQGYYAPVTRRPALAGAGDGVFVKLTEYFSAEMNPVINQKGIRSQRTLDGGESWSDLQYVNSTALFSQMDDVAVVFATDGNFVVASWLTTNMNYPVNSLRMLSVSTDYGLTWGGAKIIPGSMTDYRGALVGGPVLTVDGPNLFRISWDDKAIVYNAFSDSFGELVTGVTPPVVDKSIVYDGSFAARVFTVHTHDEGDNTMSLSTYSEVSNDGGATWGSTTLILQQTMPAFAVQNTSYGEPEIARAGGGGLAVLVNHVWNGQHVAGENVIVVDSFVAESYNGGLSWPFVEQMPMGVSAFAVAGGRVTAGWSPTLPGPVWSDIMYTTKRFGVQSAAEGWMLYE